MSKVEEIEAVEGVAYTFHYGPKLRVVFQHGASTDSLREVEAITGCAGELGCEQEHLPSVEYPLEVMEAQHD